jgi:hypothetical protein
MEERNLVRHAVVKKLSSVVNSWWELDENPPHLMSSKRTMNLMDVNLVVMTVVKVVSVRMDTT